MGWDVRWFSLACVLGVQLDQIEKKVDHSPGCYPHNTYVTQYTCVSRVSRQSYKLCWTPPPPPDSNLTREERDFIRAEQLSTFHSWQLGDVQILCSHIEGRCVLDWLLNDSLGPKYRFFLAEIVCGLVTNSISGKVFFFCDKKKSSQNFEILHVFFFCFWKSLHPTN